MTQAPGWVAVARIARAHGIKGEVAIAPLSEVDSRFEAGSRLFLEERADTAVTIASVRPHHARLIVAFEGVADRTEAERLTGRYLFAPASSAPALPPGSYWAYQLVGCEVVTEGGRPLGTVREVIHGRANDVWVAANDAGEVLVPALKDVVTEVDVSGGRIVVREVPGLTAEEASE